MRNPIRAAIRLKPAAASGQAAESETRKTALPEPLPANASQEIVGVELKVNADPGI